MVVGGSDPPPGLPVIPGLPIFFDYSFLLAPKGFAIPYSPGIEGGGAIVGVRSMGTRQGPGVGETRKANTRGGRRIASNWVGGTRRCGGPSLAAHGCCHTNCFELVSLYPCLVQIEGRVGGEWFVCRAQASSGSPTLRSCLAASGVAPLLEGPFHRLLLRPIKLHTTLFASQPPWLGGVNVLRQKN